MSKNKKEKDVFDEFVESPAAQLGDEFRVELENEVCNGIVSRLTDFAVAFLV
jgi:hypothetical protein